MLQPRQGCAILRSSVCQIAQAATFFSRWFIARRPLMQIAARDVREQLGRVEPPGGVLRNEQGLPDDSGRALHPLDRKSTRLNSSHLGISYAVFCLKKKRNN